MSVREGILVPSSINRGRYALDTDVGPDLTSGQPCRVYLGGQWMAGRIEHSGGLYVTEDALRSIRGYYFTADDGGNCGLCIGMKVRIET